MNCIEKRIFSSKQKKKMLDHKNVINIFKMSDNNTFTSLLLIVLSQKKNQ